jgi:hypothetical protein
MCAANEPGLKGTWTLEANALKSRVTLRFTDTEIFAQAGCIISGQEYAASDGVLTHLSEVIETDSGCIGAEKTPEGWTYWSNIMRTVYSAVHYDLDRNRLTISTSDGRKLVYRRLQGG